MEEMLKCKSQIIEEKQTPEWHCDTYCRKIRHVDCEGRKYTKEDAPDLCPYFDEMLY